MKPAAVFALGTALTEAGEDGKVVSITMQLESVLAPLMAGQSLGTVVKSLPVLTAAQRKSVRAGLHALVDLVMDCEDNPTAAVPVSNGIAGLIGG